MAASCKTTPSSHGNTIVHRILMTVANHEQCDVLDLPPLSTTIDPDALTRVAHGTGVTEIAFPYHGYHICITGDGQVDVTPEQG